MRDWGFGKLRKHCKRRCIRPVNVEGNGTYWLRATNTTGGYNLQRRFSKSRPTAQYAAGVKSLDGLQLRGFRLRVAGEQNDGPSQLC